MKKITLIIAMTVLGSAAFAQFPNIDLDKNPVNVLKKDIKDPLVRPTSTKFITSKKTGSGNSVQTTETYWLNYGQAANTLYGSLSATSYNYLCRDSVWGQFGTTYANVWIHELVDVLDVNANSDGYWQAEYPTMNWNKFTAYSIDSLAVQYAYERTNPNVLVVDTLVVHLYADVMQGANIGISGYFGGAGGIFMKGCYGLPQDSLYMPMPKYDYTKNKPKVTGAPVLQTVKIPLTALDTAIFYARIKDVPLNTVYNVNANYKVVAAYSFIPGVAYTTADTMGGKKVNSFNFASLEEQGANTFPIYNYVPYPHRAKFDYNTSSIVTTGERYNQNGNSWNGYSIPTWAYAGSTSCQASYAYEHHQVYYHVTSTTVGMADLTAKTTGIELGQNVPNPANGNTMIGYQIENGAAVTLEIHDITGKKVMSVEQGHQSAGTHTIQINAGALNNGVYFYTLKAGEFSVTKKMTVVE